MFPSHQWPHRWYMQSCPFFKRVSGSCMRVEIGTCASQQGHHLTFYEILYISIPQLQVFTALKKHSCSSLEGKVNMVFPAHISLAFSLFQSPSSLSSSKVTYQHQMRKNVGMRLVTISFRLQCHVWSLAHIYTRMHTQLGKHLSCWKGGGSAIPYTQGHYMTPASMK